MTDVFISYSRKDKPFVQQIHRALSEQGRDVWVDWEDIPLTADWWSEICSGIEAADTFIFVITPDSVASPVCNMEIDHATRHNKRLIPVVRAAVDEKIMLAQLGQREVDEGTRKTLQGRSIVDVAKDNWQALSRHNWLFFKDDADFESNYSLLLKAIDTDLDYARAHTRLTVRASEWERKARNDSFLLRGDDLLTAEAWLAQAVGKDPAPTPLHAEYIAESRQAENTRQRQALAQQQRELALQRQSAERLRILAAVMFLSFVVTLGLAGFAFVSRQQAEDNAATATIAQGEALHNAATALAAQEVALNNASTAVSAQSTAERRADEADSVALAEQAQVVAVSDPFLAYALGLHAANIPTPPPRALEVLSSLAYDNGAVREFIGHNAAVTTIAFSADGTRALSTDPASVILWDVATGSVIRQFSLLLASSIEGNWVSAVAISADMQRVVVGYGAGTIIVLDSDPDSISFGLPLMTFSSESFQVTALALSPNQQFVLSGWDNGVLTLWDMDSGEPVKTYDDHTSRVHSVAFNADGTRALSASETQMYVWNTDASHSSFTRRVRAFENIEQGVTRAALSPDASLVLSAASDGNITLWNVARGKEHWTRSAQAMSLAFSPNGLSALVGMSNGNLLYWNTDPLSASFGRTLRSFIAHQDVVWSLAFSADQRFALSGSADRSLILWDISTAGQIGSLSGFYGVNQVVFSPTGQRALAVTQDFTLVSWDVDDASPTFGQPQHTIYTPAYQSYPTSAALSADGWHALTGACGAAQDGVCVSGELILWDMDNAQVVWRVNAHSNDITAAAFSPDRQHALTGSCGDYDPESGICLRGELIVWTLAGAQPLQTFLGHTDEVRMIQYSPDGQRAVSLADDNTLILWDINTLQPLHQFSNLESRVLQFTFSPDGETLLVGSEDGSLNLWDVNPPSATLGELVRPFIGHTQRVTSIAFSPNGAQVLSGARDGVPILWDVATGTILRTFPQYEEIITGIAFSPEGERALIAAGYSTILWRIDATLPQLVTWLYDHRDIDADFTCNERARFGVEPLCNAQGSAPTFTPFATLAPNTATPTFTPSPTVNATLTTLTPTMAPTATFTPTPTPIEAGFADFGEQCGQVPFQSSESWQFRARPGERVTLIVSTTCVRAGGTQLEFDTTVTIYAPDGSQLGFNDDDGVSTNSRLEDVFLPVGGVYQIVVGSYLSQSGGTYTLIIMPAEVTPTATLAAADTPNAPPPARETRPPRETPPPPRSPGG